MANALIIIVLIVGYLIPALVALDRGHRDAAGIFVLNILLGWTLLGWIVALIWACSGVNERNVRTAARSSSTALSRSAAASVSSEIERLTALRDKGAISLQEFEILKGRAIGTTQKADDMIY